MWEHDFPSDAAEEWNVTSLWQSGLIRAKFTTSLMRSSLTD